MTLASGGSPMFPLVVHKSRGDNVGAVEEMMCVMCVDATEGA